MVVDGVCQIRLPDVSATAASRTPTVGSHATTQRTQRLFDGYTSCASSRKNYQYFTSTDYNDTSTYGSGIRKNVISICQQTQQQIATSRYFALKSQHWWSIDRTKHWTQSSARPDPSFSIMRPQNLLVVSLTEAYFAIDSSTSAATAGMNAIAGALTLFAVR